MGCQCHAPATLPQEKNLMPIVQEAGWVPGLITMGVKNLKPIGIRFRTVQPNYAIWPTLYQYRLKFIWSITFILHPHYYMSS